MCVFECSHCEGCAYNRHYSGRGSAYLPACHYLLDTGKMRGSTVDDCTRYIPKENTPEIENRFNRV